MTGGHTVSGMTRRTSIAVVGCLVLAGCTSTSSSSQPPSRSSGKAPAQPSDPVAAETTLNCSDQIVTDRPADNLHTVKGVVALPVASTAGTLRANPVRPQSQAELFAKQGLVVRAGRTFDLVVPPEERNRLAMGWGSSGHKTWRLHVSCPHTTTAGWLAFPGGYYVPRRACVSLIVRTASTQERVRIGVGAAC